MYPCVYYRVPEFQKTNSDHLGIGKIWHATIVTIFWCNCSKILRPNLPDKSNGEHFEKINIETVITYNNISLFQIKVYLENFKLYTKFDQEKEW